MRLPLNSCILIIVLTRCDKLLKRSVSTGAVNFLATNDADAADAFNGAFGCRLIIQDKVKRPTASKREIHFVIGRHCRSPMPKTFLSTRFCSPAAICWFTHQVQ